MKIISKRIVFAAMAGLAFLPACQNKQKTRTLYVTNPLDIERSSETISVPADLIREIINESDRQTVSIKDGDKILTTQSIDHNNDGVIDDILFQIDLKPNEEKKLTIQPLQGEKPDVDPGSPTTHSRFVPERIDDYAWENDRVAFRTYGPKAEALADSGKAGGTLTSGIDCWFKRVEYPVIDKWYKNNLEESGYYHIDHGEGYDPYHVGVSRGCGGLGIWDGDSLYVSKNFISHKTLASGPIRTVFELTYAPWKANDKIVQEKKVISLDLGSNLTRYEVHFESNPAPPSVAIGLTLHNNDGEIRIDSTLGYMRYWENIDDSYLGTGVVLDPSTMLSAGDYRSEKKDQSHLLMMGSTNQNKIVYYAGFGWKKSGQFSTADDWDNYLAAFSRRITSPPQMRIE